MSSFGALYVGSSGLQTSQNALNTTAHNLANVGTDGYTRQQVYQADRENNTVGASSRSMMQAGLGVTYAEVRQVRDFFLDKYYRTENGRQAFYETSYSATSEVETLFGELEGVAFQGSLSELYTAFEEFDKIPDDSNNQDLVVLKATAFLERAKDVYDGLKGYQKDINTKISTTIDRINEIGKEVTTLNKQILAIESGGVENANDLRDQRNSLLDELSGYGKIDAKEDVNGIVSVRFENEEFIKGTRYYQMEGSIDSTTNFVTPIWSHLTNKETGEEHPVYNFATGIESDKDTDIGSLKAYVLSRGDYFANYTNIEGINADTYNKSTGMSTMLSAEAQLDQLVHKVVTAVNDILCPNKKVTDSNGIEYTVWDSSNAVFGSTGVGPGTELFSRNSVNRYTEKTLTVSGKTSTYYVYNGENENDKSSLYTLDNVKVNPALLENQSLLPHLSANGAVNYDTTDKLVKLFSTSFITLNPNENTKLTIEEYYENMTDLFATGGSAYYNKALTVSGTVESIQNQRQQVLGVSSDEELSNMIKYQNAFNASSRYINVVSEMIEHLITQLG